MQRHLEHEHSCVRLCVYIIVNTTGGKEIACRPDRFGPLYTK